MLCLTRAVGPTPGSRGKSTPYALCIVMEIRGAADFVPLSTIAGVVSSIANNTTLYGARKPVSAITIYRILILRNMTYNAHKSFTLSIFFLF